MTLIKSAPSYQKAHGFTLLEMIIVSGVLISFMSFGLKYITQNVEQASNQITAQQLQQVTKAAQHYVQDHYQQLSQSTDISLTWDTLKDNSYVSESLAELNHYNQNYQFALQKDKGFLQLLLTTHGGQVINENNLRKIVTMAGSQAGYTTLLHPNKIMGHQGSWSIDIEDTVEIGHVASLTIINEKEVMDAANFLRRTEISGHTEYNRMDTDLQISNSKKILFEKDAGFQLTQYQLKSINKEANSTLTIENTDNPYISLETGEGRKLDLTDADLSFTSPNNSSIGISGGGNKFFNINHPNSHAMELWSNFLNLTHEGSEGKIRLSTQYQNDPTISVTGEGWGNISKDPSVPSLTNYAEINSKFIKIPTYSYYKDEFVDGRNMVKRVCTVAGTGALFLVKGEYVGHGTLAVCVATNHAIVIFQKTEEVSSYSW